MPVYNYLPSTIASAQKLTAGTVSRQSHDIGIAKCEPLIIMIDSLHQYAIAYETRMGGKLAEDYVLGAEWIKAICAVREMLNGDGAVAMASGRTTDSKDNGTCEAMFWSAMETAGFTESDIV